MEIPTIHAEDHLSEPWFTLISLGLKTCEGRLHKHRFKLYKIGDIIKCRHNEFVNIFDTYHIDILTKYKY